MRPNPVREILLWGLQRACQGWKIVVWLWLANLLFAVLVIYPISVLIFSGMANSAGPGSLSDNFAASWWTDFTLLHKQSLTDLSKSIWVAGALYMLFNLFLSGGSFNFLISSQGTPSLASFAGASGAYFGRFVRLFVLAFAGYGAVLGLATVLSKLVDTLSRDGSDQALAWWGHSIGNCVTVLLFFSVGIVLDFARARTVLLPTNSMAREFLSTLRFVAYNALRIATLYILLAMISAVLMAVYWIGARALVGTMTKITLLLVLQQVFMFSRCWLRLATWGSILCFARGGFLHASHPKSAATRLPAF